jgi:hypothetical protein
VAGVHRCSYHSTTAEVYAWLTVPIFTTSHFPGMPYERRRRLLDAAYRDIDPDEPSESRWVQFLAVADGAGRPSG